MERGVTGRLTGHASDMGDGETTDNQRPRRSGCRGKEITAEEQSPGHFFALRGGKTGTVSAAHAVSEKRGKTMLAVGCEETL